MSTVALYGFATTTRDGIWNTSADEIWSLAWAYKYDLPRIDLLLEIHPIQWQARSEKPEYEKARQHMEWLRHNQEIPVYMMDVDREIPMSVRYPIEDVRAMLPASRRRSVFSSSFDYLMGLALLRRFQRIELYGFEMGSDTEFRYQREGAAYWIAFADAQGIEVVLPDKTALLRKKMYGYEGGSMIYRQDLERLKEVREQQKRDAFARLSNLEGQLKATNMVFQNLKWRKLAQERDKQYRIALVTSGALQEIEYLLKEIDLEEPSEVLVDPVEYIPAT